MGGQFGVYKCPGDTTATLNGDKLRSYSMQSFMGTVYDAKTVTGEVTGYHLFRKSNDLNLNVLAPSDAIVFLEENMGSLNDGYLQVDPAGFTFPDVPGSYHDLSICGISFADGHAEGHKWVTSLLKIPIVVGKGYGTGGANSVSGGPLNADWKWFATHCTAKVQ